jgi:hypothetical protein
VSTGHYIWIRTYNWHECYVRVVIAVLHSLVTFAVHADDEYLFPLVKMGDVCLVRVELHIRSHSGQKEIELRHIMVKTVTLTCPSCILGTRGASNSQWPQDH